MDVFVNTKLEDFVDCSEIPRMSLAPWTGRQLRIEPWRESTKVNFALATGVTSANSSGRGVGVL